MQIVSSVSEKEPPVTFEKLSKILQNSAFAVPHNTTFMDTFYIIKSMLSSGSKLEGLLPNLILLLTSDDQALIDNGLRVLDLLIFYRVSYSKEFMAGIKSEIEQFDLSEAIKPLVDAKLSKFIT